jgi:uncharacterized pyridoxal phosphate-containing UPF0001 family protein
MAELISGLSAAGIAANLKLLREQIAATAADAAGNREGRPEVQVLAAVKYVACAELPLLAEAGIELVGENRAQDLQEKVAAHGQLFQWDFIGQLQSRRVKLIVPHVRLIHSVASESALAELRRHRADARPGLALLLEVNVAGLMTMPPLTSRAEDSRRWFAALRGLADERGLHHLSMGTTQDHLVAIQEGATIVRIGTKLYA